MPRVVQRTVETGWRGGLFIEERPFNAGLITRTVVCTLSIKVTTKAGLEYHEIWREAVVGPDPSPAVDESIAHIIICQ